MKEENNTEGPQYDLRSRDTIIPPSRYALQDQLQGQRVEDKVKTLTRKSADKKGLTTKKIMQIKKLIEEKGSRKKLKFFHKSLIMVKREAENLHEELMELLAENDQNYSDDWIEDISFNVDECSREINEYLISRRDDPLPDTISKASFVNEYLRGFVQEEISNEGISDLANQLNKLTIKVGENSITKEALAAAKKHKEIKRKQSIRDQTTIKKSAQISNGSQQRRVN